MKFLFTILVCTVFPLIVSATSKLSLSKTSQEIVDLKQFNDISAIFFMDLIKSLNLQQLTIIVHDVNCLDFKWYHVKNFTRTLGSKAQIKPAEMVSCDQEMDEKYGFLALTKTTEHVSKLHQNCPQAVWLFKSLNGLTDQSKEVMLADSKVYLYSENYGSITLSEVYYKTNVRPLITDWGVWTFGAGLIHIKGQRWERRKDLTNVHIEATSLRNPPFVIIENIHGSNDIQVLGYFGDIWSVLQDELNFTSRFRESIDDNWGVLAPDGTWNGMMGMLTRNESDMAVADMSITGERARVAKFFIPIYTINFRIFFKAQRQDIDWLLFVKLFSSDLWTALFAVILTVSCLFTYLVNFLSKSRTDHTIGLVTGIGIISNQGSFIESTARAPRIVLILLLFTGLVINASYSANLTSLLFVRKEQFPFTDFESLYRDTDFKIGTVPGSIVQGWFANAPEGTAKNLLYKSRFVHVKDAQHGVELMESNDKFAFVWDEVTVFNAIDDTCKLQSIKVQKLDFTMYARKDFPYFDIMNNELRKMRESGQFDKLWDKWTPHQRTDCLTIKAGAVEFGKIIAPFSLLFASIALSFLIFLCEKCFKGL